MSKSEVQPERPQTWRLCVAYWVSRTTRAQAHTHVAPPPHTHTHMDARTHTGMPCPHVHACTHTHGNIYYLLLFQGLNGFVTTPQCDVIHTLSLLLKLHTNRSLKRVQCFSITIYNCVPHIQL